ncbi:hypothetical protein RIB2604_02002070 [Aspergillus luchuensis]|uniref:Uncharacterized protein n=1 Tax=Aspergillus kawachii TaxID=1069201 RepID=A0A146FI14_ASPKA|nr:hypothetical protein RIB2604_02002070 [Aspergillus luchuensis]
MEAVADELRRYDYDIFLIKLIRLSRADRHPGVRLKHPEVVEYQVPGVTIPDVIVWVSEYPEVKNTRYVPPTYQQSDYAKQLLAYMDCPQYSIRQMD